jgi:hypothetical protein
MGSNHRYYPNAGHDNLPLDLRMERRRSVSSKALLSVGPVCLLLFQKEGLVSGSFITCSFSSIKEFPFDLLEDVHRSSATVIASCRQGCIVVAFIPFSGRCSVTTGGVTW